MPRRWRLWAHAGRPRIGPFRRAIQSLVGTRIRCIRERPARKRTTSKLCSQRPGFRKDPGLFAFCFTHRPAHRRGRRSMDRTAGNGGRSLTTCRKTMTSVLADGRSCIFADVAQLAERDHAMVEATSSRLVIRSTSGVPMHSVAARVGCWRPGCARPLARPRAARHHVRRDARAWTQSKWISSPPP